MAQRPSPVRRKASFRPGSAITAAPSSQSAGRFSLAQPQHGRGPPGPSVRRPTARTFDAVPPRPLRIKRFGLQAVVHDPNECRIDCQSPPGIVLEHRPGLLLSRSISGRRSASSRIERPQVAPIFADEPIVVGGEAAGGDDGVGTPISPAASAAVGWPCLLPAMTKGRSRNRRSQDWGSRPVPTRDSSRRQQVSAPAADSP